MHLALDLEPRLYTKHFLPEEKFGEEVRIFYWWLLHSKSAASLSSLHLSVPRVAPRGCSSALLSTSYLLWMYRRYAVVLVSQKGGKKQKNCTSSVTLRASLGFFIIIIPPLAKTQCLLVRFPSFIFCCKSQSASTTFLSLTLSLLSPSHSVTGRGQSILYGLANNRNVISTPTGFRVILWHQTQEAQVSWSEKMWEVTGVQNSQNVNYPDFNYTQLKGNLERKEE